jgi:hypothetical protein
VTIRGSRRKKMLHVVRRAKFSWVWWSGGVAIALVLLATNCLVGPAAAQRDARETPHPETFLSGGARSEIVLREISETLKRIDSRLERFEKVLRECDPENSNQRSAPRTPTGGNLIKRDSPENGVPEDR